MDTTSLIVGIIVVVLALLIGSGIMDRGQKAKFRRAQQDDLEGVSMRNALMGTPCILCGKGVMHLVIETKANSNGVYEPTSAPELRCTNCGKNPVVAQ